MSHLRLDGISLFRAWKPHRILCNACILAVPFVDSENIEGHPITVCGVVGRQAEGAAR
jgi:hypothetical protein